VATPDPLSQQDVDSLLKGATRPASATEVVPYNFRRPPRISRERQAALDAMHERLASGLQGVFSSRLRRNVDVGVVSVVQATFGEFLLALSTPCAAYLVELGDERSSNAVIDFDPELAAFLVDRLFGGTGEAPGPRRALTALEQGVLGDLADRLLVQLQTAYAETVPIAPRRSGFEAVADSLHVAGREDNVLIVILEVKGGPSTGYLTLCLLLTAFERFLQEKAGPQLQAPRGRPEDIAQARQLIDGHVRSAGVPVAVRLPEFHLSALDVALLREGQLLETGQSASGEVELHVNGRRLALGHLGRQQGFVGLRLTGWTPTTEPVPATRPSRRKRPG
jgi:flagellar motor switch protein FliM